MPYRVDGTEGGSEWAGRGGVVGGWGPWLRGRAASWLHVRTGGPACALLVVIMLGGCSDDASSPPDATSTTVTAAEAVPLEGELSTGTRGPYEVRLPVAIRHGLRSQ